MKDALSVMSAKAENPPASFPLEKKWSYAIASGGFALLTVVAAKVAIPLPGTPIPGTLQTLAVLLAGLVLGARFGALSQAAYLGLGLGGLPVFALPGAGPGYLFGPTGGYLIGFLAASFLVGTLAPPSDGTGFLRRLLAVAAGIATIHAAGVLWLGFLSLPSMTDAWRAGSLPFLGFDLAKGVLACALAGAWSRVARVAPWTNRFSA
ncbi:MAG TPA: biotin transporter BioY [Candidatus Polarisedimenticolia bacterium]|nr:biotin transporter BioY [Candidatus Polarisedimenticolia bacterium]